MSELRRLGNLITLLLPARSYKINCALTTEKLMPGIEQFACRLLLIFDQLYPSEIQNYFGLNEREREVLLDSLLASRLVRITPEGCVEASPFLRKHAEGNDGKPSLVKYQERTEDVTFDLLTLSVCKAQPYRRITSGLPELLPRNRVGADTATVMEAFSLQFHDHLILSRTNEYERQRTHLYKIMGCSSQEMVQIPVEVEVHYEAIHNSEPRKLTRSYERVNNNSLPLTNELETHIANFLGEQELTEIGINCECYCDLVNDPVLKRFANGYKFDYSAWLEAREQRKTGYGSQQTRGIMGAVYLPDNAKRFISELRDALRHHEDKLPLKIMWYSSEVPLWGANSSRLVQFNRDLKEIMESNADDQSVQLVLIHVSDSKEESRIKRQRHIGRFPNGVSLSSKAQFDRLELLLIPGVIGMVQYHAQPNQDSAMTLPVGYVTTDPERLTMLESLLAKRAAGAKAEVSWDETRQETLDSLLTDEVLAALDPESGPEVTEALCRKRRAERGNAARAILSLRRS
ncbi:hypothetical protein ACNO5E_12065 [Vibrio parahaemolyticus]